MKIPAALAVCLSILVTGCFKKDSYEHVEQAVAMVQPASGSNVHGFVQFTQTSDGVRVQAKINNLEPGSHGFHVHHYGDAYAQDANSVCTHYNPTKQPHGAPGDEARHLGDMGNVAAGSNGIAHLDYIDTHLKLNGPHSIVGRSVIIHEKADDFTTQPTGNAGKKFGVGVIGIKNPSTVIDFE